MPTFGSFQTVAELHRGPFGSLYASRRAGQGDPAPAAAAVKTCRPPADVLTDDGVTRVTAWFLESAKLQQQAAASTHPGAANWLKVHDFTKPQFGMPVGEAYLVTDLAARGSVAKLISTIASIDDRSLHNIARSVVQGLLALRAVANRAHGSLTPGNVLLLDDDAPATCRVVLADPAPADLLGPNPFGDDLHALGRLLYALAMHREHGGGWPLSPSPMWAALSPDPQRAQAWRELVNRLLDPSLRTTQADDAASPALTLEQLAELIDRLTPGTGAKRNKRSLLIAAAAVVALAGAGGYLVYENSRGPKVDPATLTAKRWAEEPAAEERWQAVCDAYYNWVWSLTKLDRRPEAPAALVAAFPKRRDLYQANAPELIDVLKLYGEEGQLHPGAIADAKTREPDFRALRGAPTPRAQSDSGVERTEELQKKIAELKTFFSDKWPAAALLKQSALDFAAKGGGWTPAADRARQLHERLAKAAEHGEDLSPALDEVVSLLPTLKKITEARARLDAAAKSLASAGDPVLAKLPAAADAMVAATPAQAPAGQDPLVTLLAQVEHAEALGKRLADYIAGPWRAVDTDEFLKSPEHAAMAANTAPDADLFDAWIKLADQYPALPKDQNPIPAVVAALGTFNQTVEQYQQQVAAAPAMDAKVRARIDDLRARVNTLKELAWTKKNREKIESDSRALSAALAGAKSDLDTAIASHERDAAASLEQLVAQYRAQDSIVAASPAIDADWRTRRDAVLADKANLKKDELAARLRSIQQGLRELDQQIPPPPAERNGGAAGEPSGKSPLATAVITERDRWIGAALKQLGSEGVTSSPAIAQAAAPASTGFAAWLNESAPLRTSLQQIERLLSNGYGLRGKPAADPTAKSAAELWTAAQADPLLAKAPLSAAADPLRARITDLTAISTEPSADTLVAKLSTAPDARPDLALAAWERLGSPDLAWPAKPADLNAAAALRTKLDDVARKQIADPARRDELARAIAEDFKTRWKSFAARAFTPATGSPADRALLLKSALAAAPAFGIDDSTPIDDRLRFNLLADRLLKQLQGASDAQAAAANTLFLNSVAQLPREFTTQASIAALTAALAPLRNPSTNTAPVVDVTKLGPGAVGLRGQPNADLTTITFDLSGNPLAFHRVEYIRADSTPDVVYLGRTEVSLELCAKLIALARLNRESFLSLSNIDPSDESWYGPRGWIWDRSFQPSPYWVGSQPPYARTPYFAPGLAAPGQASAGRGLAEPAGGNPRGGSPVQRISSKAAATLAASVGCRLPSLDEWRAAYTQMGPTDNASWNLRDRTFQRQFAYIEPLRARSVGLELDAYPLPDDVSYAKGGPGSPSQDFDDGVPLFRPVDAGPQKFPNLVGNVAEFVTSIPGATQAPALVIGGSALSAVTVRVDEPVPEDTSKNYYDVGFRLAFSATGSKPAADPLAKQIADRLSGFPFLFE